MKLVKANVQDMFELTMSQQGMLFHYLENSEVNLYNIQLALVIDGELKEELLRKAFEHVQLNNEALRSVFQWEKLSRPIQIVLKQCDLDFNYINLSAKDTADANRFIDEFIEKDRDRRFDLNDLPLRIHLIRISDQRCVLVITHHHILYDGWSTGILLRELFSAYHQLDHQAELLRDTKPGYREVLMQMANRANNLAEAKQYWADLLRGYELKSLLDLPQTGTVAGSGLKEMHLVLEREAIERFAVSNKVSFSAVIYAAYSILLQTYANSNDIVFGIPVSDRLPGIPGMEDIMGTFINTVPFRHQTSGEETAQAVIRQVNNQLIANNQYAGISYNEIKGLMNIRPREEMFQTILAVENYPLDLKGIQCNEGFTIRLRSTYGDTGIPIVIMVFLREKIEVLINYQAAVVPEDFISRFAERFRMLTEQLISDPSRLVRDINCLSAQETHQLLTVYNDTAELINKPGSVLQHFKEQVIRHPEAIAVQFEDVLLTYRQLDELSNQVAHCLISRYQLKEGDLAAVIMDRSDWLIVSILAILKTGAAYIPVDPEYPAERINKIISDAQPALLLLEMYYFGDIDNNTIPVFAIDVEFIEGEFSKEAPEIPISGEALAYVIYTSGSTGSPKGVMIRHLSLVNYITWAKGQYVKAGNSNFPLYTSISFDLTVTSIFTPLISGGKIIIYKGTERTGLLEKAFTERDSTIIKLTPSHLKIVREAGYVLNTGEGENKILIVGGERLDTALAKAIYYQYQGRVEIYNEYGPTEATVGCMIYKFDPEDNTVSVPIGKPIANTAIYLLDRFLRPVIPGAPGEIYIGGQGLATGYLNNNLLTEDKFIKAPVGSNEGQRLYKSGDTARWLPGMELEYIGRGDNQVKVKGHRIEMGEIEQVLQQHPYVEEAVVTLKDKNDPDKGLLAYYVPRQGKQFRINQLKKRQPSENNKMQLHTLPNGLKMYAYNKTELEFVYDEIYTHQVYLKFGMHINEGACVVDIGANAGMFSIQASLAAEIVTIYSFEPLPPTFALLQANTGLYKGNFRLFNCGIGEREEERVFHFYPNATVLSTSSTDATSVRSIVKQFIVNSAGVQIDDLPEEKLDELLKERLVFEEYTCPIKTVSGIIKENGIQQIDYLKIDVEDAEWAVLMGIEEKDWEKIMQLVIEVHDDSRGRLQNIAGLLKDHGYFVHINQSDDAKNTNLYDLYATRYAEEVGFAAAVPTVSQYTFIEPEEAAHDIRKFLEEKLPEFMLPASFIPINGFPLTINGKIDYAALPDPEGPGSGTIYEAPQTVIEKKLEQIWKEILATDRVGLNDDFFTLGGESLAATRLVNRVRREFSVDVSINTVFDHTTLGRLAACIESIKRSEQTAITKLIDKPGRIPLSFAQERLWFIDQMMGSLHYHMPLVLAVQGQLQVQAFYTAIRQLVNRHEALRTVFATHQGEPYQCVLAENQWMPENAVDIAGYSVNQIEELIQEAVNRPFDLTKDHPLRITLLLEEGSVKNIVLVIHHISFDGWSVGILSKELPQLYNAEITKQQQSLKELQVQYADYSLWQHRQLQHEWLAEGLAYWKEKLKQPELAILPADKERPAIISTKGADHRVHIGKALTEGIMTLSQRSGATLFMSLLTVFKILLLRYTGQGDICVGTPVANRDQPETEGLIGFFANTLALRSRLSAERSFPELLQAEMAVALEAYKYQYVPFEKIIEQVVTDRDMSRNPLFQCMFIMQENKLQYDLELGAARAIPVKTGHEVAKFDLSLEVTQTGHGLEIIINYCTDLFYPSTIAFMGEHYRELLASVVADPQLSAGRLNMLSKAEKEQILAYNDTTVDYGKKMTVLDLIDEQVQRTPKATALIFEGMGMSYEVLINRAQALAGWLLSEGIGKGSLVPLCLDRSFEMVIGMLGILKAGAAYVPIDPAYPAERIAFILADTAASCVLTQSKYRSKLPMGVPALALDEWEYNIITENITAVPVDPADLAYVIYTSGTTGEPKGVMNQHSGLYNRLVWMRDYLEVDHKDVYLQKTTFCFDVSVWELLLPLMTGARMVLAKPGGHRDSEYLVSLIREHKITTVHFVPSMLSAFLTDAGAGSCTSLRQVICSGEELKPAMVSGFQQVCKGAALYNFYGPTEAAIDVTAIRLHEGDYSSGVPIGRPIANTKIYIVDDFNNIQPHGIAGELLIGGVQVARGYLGRPELTAEKFIADTITVPGPETGRLYRTGDWARWLPDGNIAYMGRNDQQVKLRGYRIELGEIEAALERFQQVQQAVVTVKLDPDGNKWLVAYVKANAAEADLVGLKEELKDKLPDYMIPSVIMEVKEFPLTDSGKIDRKRLPEPQKPEGERRAYVAPATGNEKKLAEIWSKLLHVEQIGIHDNFFELGGHSLLATRTLSAIQREFSIRISLPVFFQLSTIEKLSRYLEVMEAATNKENKIGLPVIEL